MIQIKLKNKIQIFNTLIYNFIFFKYNEQSRIFYHS